ncbi:uncharacterized protein LOC143255633 isoform X2 [Tachypleus tridentatus]
MKNPRLPGADKFKFSAESNYPLSADSSETDGSASPSLFVRGRPGRSSCPPLSTMSSQGFNRSDIRRKPVLPITSKKTSRVLNNTNMELNVDTVDTRTEDGSSDIDRDLTKIPKPPSQFPIPLNPMEPTDVLSEGRKISLPIFRSLRSSTTNDKSPTFIDRNIHSKSISKSTDSNSSRMMSHLTSQRQNDKSFNWMNYRSSTSSSRLSMSSQSSCASEDDIWVLRK